MPMKINKVGWKGAQRTKRKVIFLTPLPMCLKIDLHSLDEMDKIKKKA